MAIILGLDVSTSVTGICMIDSDVVPDDQGSHILLLDRIEFPKCKTLWDKADAVERRLFDVRKSLFDQTNAQKFVERVVLEEPLMGFRPGMSSAQTITTLMRFNGIVSFIARNVYGKDPEYINAPHARKLCGIKLQKTVIGGPQKEQVFAHMKANDLKHIVWPVKKSGAEVDWSRDATDAYVIARAAQLSGQIQAPAKKSKKVAKPKAVAGNTVP